MCDGGKRKWLPNFDLFTQQLVNFGKEILNACIILFVHVFTTTRTRISCISKSIWFRYYSKTVTNIIAFLYPLVTLVVYRLARLTVIRPQRIHIQFLKPTSFIKNSIRRWKNYQLVYRLFYSTLWHQIISTAIAWFIFAF